MIKIFYWIIIIIILKLIVIITINNITKPPPPNPQNRFTPAHAKPRQFSPSQNFRPWAPALSNPTPRPPLPTRRAAAAPSAVSLRCASTGRTARPTPSATCSLFQLARRASLPLALLRACIAEVAATSIIAI